MKKTILLTAIILSSSITAFAGSYTSNGKNVFYDGHKIGEIQKAWSGEWKGLCEHRSSGSVRTYKGKDAAIRSIVRECRKY